MRVERPVFVQFSECTQKKKNVNCVRFEGSVLDSSFVQLSCTQSNDDENPWELTRVDQQTCEALVNVN